MLEEIKYTLRFYNCDGGRHRRPTLKNSEDMGSSWLLTTTTVHILFFYYQIQKGRSL